MNWKKENGERDEKRLNARYPTLTRDSYVPWDVGEERMCHRWNTDATRIVKKTIRSLADKTFCTIPDTFNKSNSIFQTNTQNNLKVARRCVIGNYRIYCFPCKTVFLLCIHGSKFRSKLPDDWWLHTAYVETCRQVHKVQSKSVMTSWKGLNMLCCYK